MRGWAPVWLMGLSNTTFGLVGGFIVLPLPQLLAAQHVPEARITAISGACLLPGFWVFALGPLLDFRFSRRWWAGVFAGLSGVAMMVAVLLRANLAVLEAGIIVSYAAAALSSNALGGWLAGVVPMLAERAGDDANHEGAWLSSWTQVGVFLGNGGMAVLAGEGLRRLPLNVVAPLLGVVVVLPALVFPWIPLVGQQEIGGRSLGEGFREFGREVVAVLRGRHVWLTLLLFVLPTGSFALSNALGGVAGDYHASEAFVTRMGGLGLSFAGAASCLLLPMLARRVRALPLYLLIGTVGSVFTLAMLALPRNPGTFAVAFVGESMVQALSFTAAVAICFAVIGENNPLAGTQFGLLTAVTVLPIVAMGWLDGRAYSGDHAWLPKVFPHGVTGMYLFDGGLSLLACAVMAVVVLRWMPRRREIPPPPSPM